MIAQADVCLALPGDPGTLEEISEAFSWTLLGDNPNLCILYNVEDYYQPLVTMYDAMTASGFFSVKDRQALLFSDSLTEILDFMNNYQQSQIKQY